MVPALRAEGEDDVAELAAAVHEAAQGRARSPGARAGARPRRSRAPRSRRRRSSRDSQPNPAASGKTASRAFGVSRRWPESGSRAVKPDASSISRRAASFAIPKPPPCLRAKAATVRSASPSSSGVRSPRRSASQSRSAPGGAARSASVSACPLPRRGRRSTQRARPPPRRRRSRRGSRRRRRSPPRPGTAAAALRRSSRSAPPRRARRRGSSGVLSHRSARAAARSAAGSRLRPCRGRRSRPGRRRRAGARARAGRARRRSRPRSRGRSAGRPGSRSARRGSARPRRPGRRRCPGPGRGRRGTRGARAGLRLGGADHDDAVHRVGEATRPLLDDLADERLPERRLAAGGELSAEIATEVAELLVADVAGELGPRLSAPPRRTRAAAAASPPASARAGRPRPVDRALDERQRLLLSTEPEHERRRSACPASRLLARTG